MHFGMQYQHYINVKQPTVIMKEFMYILSLYPYPAIAGTMVADVLEKYLLRRSPVIPHMEGRISFTGPDSTVPPPQPTEECGGASSSGGEIWSWLTLLCGFFVTMETRAVLIM